MKREMQMQGEHLTIGQMCEASGVSRATFYRGWQAKEPNAEHIALRDAIQRLALKKRQRGYRLVTQHLKREGWRINHKRVLRLMREDNLLCIRRRGFVITTDSNHSWKIYPNLARSMILTGLNQLWVADITYVRLRWEFVYVAVILDVYSRRVVGWSVQKQIDTKLTLTALELALNQRRPPVGLVHHSDRGVQYACGAYVQRLESYKIVLSMSRPGNPWDNAWAESFMKTLKAEEVYAQRYRDLAHARSSIGTFIEDIYNNERLHSSLSYRSPAEFEYSLPLPNLNAAGGERMPLRGDFA
jgi:transposase InsO family protein